MLFAYHHLSNNRGITVFTPLPMGEGSKHRVIPALTYAVTLFLFLVPPHLAITIFELQPTDENAVRIIQN